MTSSSVKRPRRPRTKRAAPDALPPFRLTKRDVAVVHGVWRYRALITPQIEELFFHQGANRTRVAQRRLQGLFHHGYLARGEQPQLLTDSPKPFVYFLDERGAQLVCDMNDLPREELDWHPRHNDVSWPFLDHLLATNDVRVAVRRAADLLEVQLLEWRDDRTLRSDQAKEYVTLRGPQGGSRKAAVVPDGHFRLATAKDNYNFFLEADKRTVTGQSSSWGRRDWARKVKIYVEYHASGSYEARYGTKDLRVLTVTTGPRRLENLKSISESAGGGRNFWFTTFDEINPDTVLSEPIWRIARKKGEYALLS